MRAYMSDPKQETEPGRSVDYWREGRGTIPQWTLAAQAVREARRILAETEPREPGDTEYARLDDVRYFRRKARKDADTRSVFAAQFTAHDALADALRAFVGEED